MLRHRFDNPLKLVGEADAGYGQEQADGHTGSHIGRGAEPFTVFEHFGGFPAEAGECGVSAEEADGDGHAPVGRDYHAIQCELADQPEQEAAREIDQQRAVRKGAGHANLHQALQTVAGERAKRAEDSDQCKTQHFSNPQFDGATESREAPLRKKLLEPVGCQESSEPIKRSGPVMANSIAFEISP